jgi:hypothetical protein
MGIFMKKKRLITFGAVTAVLLIAGFMLVQFARGAEPVPESRTSWLTSTFITHRGIHDNDSGLIENTIPAFAKSAELGYPIELDVRLTRSFHSLSFLIPSNPCLYSVKFCHL